MAVNNSYRIWAILKRRRARRAALLVGKPGLLSFYDIKQSIVAAVI